MEMIFTDFLIFLIKINKTSKKSNDKTKIYTIHFQENVHDFAEASLLVVELEQFNHKF